MSELRERVAHQVALLKEGQMLEAFDLYFADFGVMHSNGELFGTGRDECRAKQMPFFESAKHIKGEISDLVLDEKSEFCVFRNQSSFEDEAGEKQQINGLHIQMWASGMIASEWFFSGKLMDEIIEAGIFSDPAHILELV